MCWLHISLYRLQGIHEYSMDNKMVMNLKLGENTFESENYSAVYNDTTCKYAEIAYLHPVSEFSDVPPSASLLHFELEFLVVVSPE